MDRNNKAGYYTRGHLRRLLPPIVSRVRASKIERQLSETIKESLAYRVNYYNKNLSPFQIPEGAPRLDQIGYSDGSYSIDLIEYTRLFPQHFKIQYQFGDVSTTPNIHSIVKSRPITENNQNSILFNLNKIRHFDFIQDNRSFSEKKNNLVWRGAAHQPDRKKFLESYFNKYSVLDIGDYHKHNQDSPWKVDFLSRREQLESKFILSIEGNDVATNTKWIMASNSLCFMARPKHETWFMEGLLIPDHHYVLLKDDYSDILEKVDYYSSHSDKALEIINNAKKHVEQFTNPKIEDWISIKVLEKYFRLSNQMIEGLL